MTKVPPGATEGTPIEADIWADRILMPIYHGHDEDMMKKARVDHVKYAYERDSAQKRMSQCGWIKRVGKSLSLRAAQTVQTMNKLKHAKQIRRQPGAVRAHNYAPELQGRGAPPQPLRIAGGRAPPGSIRPGLLDQPE